MVTRNDDGSINIRIDEEVLIKSIALLKDLRDFCNKQKEDGVNDTVNALNCAIETMMAFYAKHFDLEGDET